MRSTSISIWGEKTVQLCANPEPSKSPNGYFFPVSSQKQEPETRLTPTHPSNQKFKSRRRDLTPEWGKKMTLFCQNAPCLIPFMTLSWLVSSRISRENHPPGTEFRTQSKWRSRTPHDQSGAPWIRCDPEVPIKPLGSTWRNPNWRHQQHQLQDSDSLDDVSGHHNSKKPLSKGSNKCGNITNKHNQQTSTNINKQQQTRWITTTVEKLNLQHWNSLAPHGDMDTQEGGLKQENRAVLLVTFDR